MHTPAVSAVTAETAECFYRPYSAVDECFERSVHLYPQRHQSATTIIDPIRRMLYSGP